MSALRVLSPVADALAWSRPVVALESSVLAQGLPIPANREAAERMTNAAARAGALAAITAVMQGVCTLGVDGDELERFLRRDGIRKVSARDLPVAVAQRADGATTVAASLSIASAAGASVFATGGIGGIHRDAPFERLETLGVTVVGYGTDEMPGFFTRTTGLRLPARAESAREIADIHLAA